MGSSFWVRFTHWVLGAASILGIGAAAMAQESLDDRLKRAEQQFEANRKLTADLQKQNEALLKLLSPTARPPVNAAAPLGADEVRNIVSGYLQEREAKERAAAETAPAPDGGNGYKIGSNLTLSATWRNGLFLSAPNKDFTMHIGGWLQYDNLWWDQSTQLQTAKSATFAGPKQGVLSGPALGGIGSLEDGTFFRRIRLQLDGQFWENYEYNLTFAFENIQYSTVGMDEFWVGMTNIPVVGTVRLGHLKNAMGLEANTTASSKGMTFIDTSMYFESIELSQNDVTGIWLGNNYFDQRATWSATVFRPDQAQVSGVFFGNDQWGAQGRITALPLFENDGRCLLHLGLSGGWRSGTGSSTTQGFELRARPELRDDVPAASATGTQLVPNGNSNRLVDTGTILCQNDFLLGTELLWIWGPLSIQGEYGWNMMQDATGANNASPGKVLLAAPQDYVFSGGYLQVAYTLTGENRSYDKRMGRLDSWYFGRQGPFNNFWFVRDEDGKLNWNFGAWEIAARYTFVDLNSGQGLARINGGEADGITLGLNWYLNDNVKLQWNYVFDHRYDTPGLPGGTPANSVLGGTTRGVGMRLQFVY